MFFAIEKFKIFFSNELFSSREPKAHVGANSTNDSGASRSSTFSNISYKQKSLKHFLSRSSRLMTYFEKKNDFLNIVEIKVVILT